uniref:VQ domain-containing protein n=1 Tax=Kalanchoe fedtschenkoi TaxID=63787 RepID=A0A7N1A689_KALFE
MAASSENLAAVSGVDPFLPRQSYAVDFWPSAADTEALTKALQQSLYASFDAVGDDDFNLLLPPPPDHLHSHNHQPPQQQQRFSPFSNLDHQPTATPSASEPETATTPKRRASTAKGRVAKRKSRATKKNLTTFIAADPANFRLMVQQVTGVRFDAGSSASSPFPPLSLLKPEPRRPVGRLYGLPTLDTSSFLLDRRGSSLQSQSLAAEGPVYSSGGLNATAYGGAGYGAADGQASFPTLESWKVM